MLLPTSSFANESVENSIENAIEPLRSLNDSGYSFTPGSNNDPVALPPQLMFDISPSSLIDTSPSWSSDQSENVTPSELDQWLSMPESGPSASGIWTPLFDLESGSGLPASSMPPPPLPTVDEGNSSSGTEVAGGTSSSGSSTHASSPLSPRSESGRKQSVDGSAVSAPTPRTVDANGGSSSDGGRQFGRVAASSARKAEMPSPFAKQSAVSKKLPPVVIKDPSDPAAIRRARNTEAARRSRAKKVERIEQLEEIVSQLMSQNAMLEAENRVLRKFHNLPDRD